MKKNDWCQEIVVLLLLLFVRRTYRDVEMVERFQAQAGDNSGRWQDQERYEERWWYKVANGLQNLAPRIECAKQREKGGRGRGGGAVLATINSPSNTRGIHTVAQSLPPGQCKSDHPHT